MARVSFCGWYAVLGVLSAAASAPAEVFQVGDRVVATRQVALRVADGSTAEVSPGFVLTVTALEEGWLWVNPGKPGWIRPEHVVPLAEAEAYFTQALRRQPAAAELRYARALVAHEQGNLDAAIADLTQLIRARPQTLSFYLARGIAWFDRGDPARALADFDQAIRIDPRDSRPYNNRANILSTQGEYERAVADFNRAIELDPDNAAAFNNRGNAHEQQGNYEAAISDYRRATSLDPKYALAYNNWAWLMATCSLEEFRDAERAVRHATTACELTNYQHPLFLSTLAAAHAEAGDFEQAKQWQFEALDLLPTEGRSEFEERMELYRAEQPYRPQAGPPVE